MTSDENKQDFIKDIIKIYDRYKKNKYYTDDAYFFVKKLVETSYDRIVSKLGENVFGLFPREFEVQKKDEQHYILKIKICALYYDGSRLPNKEYEMEDKLREIIIDTTFHIDVNKKSYQVRVP